MWTLIIITLVLPNSNSGVSSTTALIDFSDQQKCETAAKAIAVPDFAQIPSTGGKSAIYRIIAQCVAR
jgi:hypothetical protein